MPASPIDVALAFIAAINAGDANALRSLMTEDHTFTDALGNSFSGAEKMFSGWQHFFHTYPEYRITIKHSFADGNKVALFGDAEGGWRVNKEVCRRVGKLPQHGWPAWKQGRSAVERFL